MRLPQMTTRRWMVAIAVVAIVLAATTELPRRAQRFRALAQAHGAAVKTARGKRWTGDLERHGHVNIAYSYLDGRPPDQEMTRHEVALVLWHLELMQKYNAAAERPWLPVEPGPPEP
jgi:hypothetical protein